MTGWVVLAVIGAAMMAVIIWQKKVVMAADEENNRMTYRAMLEAQMIRDGWTQDGDRWIKGSAIITMTWID